jgi:hypothetical protein
MARIALVAVLAAVVVAIGEARRPGGGPAPASAALPEVCLGDLTGDGVPRLPGRRLRFGINPAGVAGAVGPPVEPAPDHPGRTLAALALLRPRHAQFVLRLNRFFWSDGGAGIERFAALVRHYTRQGYKIELQLRYHPAPGREGDVAGFAHWIRRVVRRFGPNRRVTGLQIANEVNFYPIAPDASDSSFTGAKDALIAGVLAADDEARRDGFGQLTIGFNWAYRTDPDNESTFWTYLHDHGGAPFAAAVDWVGLDAYPGTVFPPADPPGGTGDGMVAAMSQLRQCFMPQAGLGTEVPIHVEENGWPTGPGRSEDQQVSELRSMVEAVNRFRGTYNVSDYRWFDLRDHNSSSANFQHHYGVLRDDYSPKPAFTALRDEFARLARRPG